MTRNDAARRLNPFEDDEFDRMFERFQHTAFRLETLQHYATPDEEKLLRCYLAGEPKPEFDQKLDWWSHLIAAAVDAGKLIQRVHVVTEPLSNYVRYELEWGYSSSVNAGEDIRILSVGAGQWPEGLPDQGYDFWLLDSRTLAELHYDHDGRFMAVDVTDDAERVSKARAWRDAALNRAASYKDYLTRFGSSIRGE